MARSVVKSGFILLPGACRDIKYRRSTIPVAIYAISKLKLRYPVISIDLYGKGVGGSLIYLGFNSIFPPRYRLPDGRIINTSGLSYANGASGSIYGTSEPFY